MIVWKKTAVLVRDKRTAFRIEFTDIVCEQIDILYRGTCNTGSEHIFLRRMGIKDGFCSFETIREEVERLIGHGTNDDKFSLFQEDTATDKVFYSDLVEFEKQKVRFEKRGKLLEEDNVGEVNMSSVTPSSLDMNRVEIDNDLRHVLSGTRFKLAIAAGLLGVIGGAGVLVQKYTGFEKVDSVLERKEYMYDEKDIISESSTEDANTEIVRTGFAEEKEVSVICKIDQGAESYKKYLARLEDSSPRFFISNFRSAVNNAKGETSTADVESVRRSLFTDFLKEMGKNVDDKLTRDFVEIHTRNFKSFSGGEWRDGPNKRL